MKWPLTTRKALLCRAFRCAEEDSNLHPVIPDQALNLVTRVSYPSVSARSSVSSRHADDTDASDDLDVATDVATTPAAAVFGLVDPGQHPDGQERSGLLVPAIRRGVGRSTTWRQAELFQRVHRRLARSVRHLGNTSPDIVDDACGYALNGSSSATSWTSVSHPPLREAVAGRPLGRGRPRALMTLVRDVSRPSVLRQRHRAGLRSIGRPFHLARTAIRERISVSRARLSGATDHRRPAHDQECEHSHDHINEDFHGEAVLPAACRPPALCVA